MSSRNIDSYSIPPAVRRAASSFRLAGWVSLWSQGVLAIVSALVLLFAAANLNTPVVSQPTIPGAAVPTTTMVNNPGTGLGSLFALIGLLILLGGAFWAYRYVMLSRQLKVADAQVRPKRTTVIQALQIGILLSLSGILVTLMGAFATVGSLFGRSVTQQFGGILGSLQFIRPIDILVVQANINIILAHFIALLASLWLLRSINR